MITCILHQNVVVLNLNSPPVNALGQDLRELFTEQYKAALLHESVEAIVILSSLPLFSAGADINEFKKGNVWQSPNLPELCLLIDDSPVLTVAAINGAAMGGGLELALSCDYRIADGNALLGLPEIQLGLLPGAGGTQRLPRLTGLQEAAGMILSGKPVTAEQALKYGLVDRLFDSSVVNAEQLENAAVSYAKELLETRVAMRPSRSQSVVVDDEKSPENTIGEVLASLGKQYRHQVAPREIAEMLSLSSSAEFDDALAAERTSFDKLLKSTQSRALTHLFFVEREALKNPGGLASTESSLSDPSVVSKVLSVGIVGGGTMGRGIAICYLDAEIPVVLVEKSAEDCERVKDAIAAHYQRMVDKSRLTQDQRDQRMAGLTLTENIDELPVCDLVIEAVFENLAIKKRVFKELDRVCKPDAILASNTSTLDINEIAAATTRPSSVIGLHFFSPANIMKLLEVVRGRHSSATAIQTSVRMATVINKVPVTVGVCFGFVGNRMLEPYFREASRLMLEGASAEQIDTVLTDFGMAMGIIAVGDLAGIDVGYRVREERREELAHDPTYQAIQDKLFELGRYGQKTGRGCYLYEGRNRLNDPEVVALCESIANEHGITRRVIDDQEILERCLYPLINEGLQILDERIAARPGDCDVIWVHGYGFPRSRGGPLHYAEAIGLDVVLKGMLEYRERLGDYGAMWFEPAPMLVEVVERGCSIKEYLVVGDSDSE